MHGLIRRAVVVAAVAAVTALVVPAAAASANDTPVLGWAPTTASGTFNYVHLNAGQAASQTFTLTNSGGSASGTLMVTLSGSAAFTTTADTCTGRSLGPGKSCTVTVTYAPTTMCQTDSATLAAAGEQATASLALNGASIATFNIPYTVLAPGTYDFGPLPVSDNCTQVEIDIYRNVTGGLNSVPSTTTLEAFIYQSDDGGTTWYGLAGGGTTGGIVSTRFPNDTFIDTFLNVGTGREVKGELTVSGGSVAVQGFLAVADAVFPVPITPACIPASPAGCPSLPPG